MTLSQPTGLLLTRLAQSQPVSMPQDQLRCDSALTNTPSVSALHTSLESHAPSARLAVAAASLAPLAPLAPLAILAHDDEFERKTHCIVRCACCVAAATVGEHHCAPALAAIGDPAGCPHHPGSAALAVQLLHGEPAPQPAQPAHRPLSPKLLQSVQMCGPRACLDMHQSLPFSLMCSPISAAETAVFTTSRVSPSPYLTTRSRAW